MIRNISNYLETKVWPGTVQQNVNPNVMWDKYYGCEYDMLLGKGPNSQARSTDRLAPEVDLVAP